ncbi:MAG: N-acetyltransferase [Pseudomonadota bacterium]
MDFRVRPFDLKDHKAVNALCDWAWWPSRSLESWAWLTAGTPGLDSATGPVGWVCEDEHGVEAFLGNFSQRFWQGDETFLGATGHTLLVNPRMRGAGRDLLRRLANQDDRFARYVFNANDRSAPMYQHHAMNPWPEPLASVKYVWRTDWTGVASERALRWFNGLSGHAASRRGGERFNSDRLWSGGLTWLADGVSEIPMSGVDDAFDRLWDRLRQDGRLLASRDAASLRWRCADPDLTRAPLMLGFEADGELAGYLLAFFSKGSEVERPALEIVDLIALRDHEARAVPALVQTLIGSARALGAARVRLPMVNPRMDELLSGPFAVARRTYGHNHCHVRWAPEVEDDLKAAWFATPYDGDYSFCLRPPPRPALVRVAA